MAVFGITLGQPAPEFRACTWVPANVYPCVGTADATPTGKRFTVYLDPDNVRAYFSPAALTVYETAGKLVAAEFDTPGVDANSEALAALGAKYGAPAAVSTKVVQNRMGATFDVVTAAWTFARLHVHYTSALGVVDKGRILVATPEGIAMMSADQAADAAEKLPL